MKVKINKKWFDGRFDNEKRFIIPLSEEQDVIFFYKWNKKHSKFGIPKEDYTKDIEYKNISKRVLLL